MILGPILVTASAVAIDQAMKKLKSGKAGKVGKKLAKHLEDAGKAAGDSRKSGSSKGKY